jgi:hypothetical protein
VQRFPEPYECIGAYLAHENAMGDLCSGKRSLILIGRAVLNKESVESNAQFDRLNSQLISMVPFAIQASTERMASNAG